MLVTTGGVLLDNKAADRLEAELHANGGGRNQRAKVVSSSTRCQECLPAAAPAA